MRKVWLGLPSLCSCILLQFEKTQSDLDDVLFKKAFERDYVATKTKIVEVQMRKTDSTQQVREQPTWAGTGGKKDRGDMNLFYWAVRTERQDMLLCEILCKIFQTIKSAGFTHVEHSLNDRKFYIPIDNFQKQVSNIVPRSVILAVRGATGGWSAPDSGGVAHHYIVGTTDDGSKLARYAPFHPEPMSSKSSDSVIFKIARENDLLDCICFSHKPVNATSRLEIDAAVKSPLFKQKMAVFFESFPLSSGEIKNTGNLEFENKRYHNSLLWYSLGMAFEENIKDSELIHVLYSNRSTAYYQLQLYTKALEDADLCISLAPQWPKGYLRKSAVLAALERHTEAQEVLDKMEVVQKELSVPKNKKRKF